MKTAPSRALHKTLISALYALLVLGLSALAITPAQAHDQLISTVPADGETLNQLPDKITLKYSGNILDVDGANQVRVTTSTGESIASESPEISGKDVSTTLLGDKKANETYTVTWRVVSEDGHPIQGKYEFVVGEGAPKTSATEATATHEASTEKQDAPETSLIEKNKGITFSLATLATVAAVIVLLLKKRRSS
ncbi:copper resistance CopC family protein [Rothia sp. CCM 9418]|uniref:copper resistance CopC family protein n=1 Tax=Rothia sp. CCM 9418 TaxID=3402661 RepID=UPI003ADE3052